VVLAVCSAEVQGSGLWSEFRVERVRCRMQGIGWEERISGLGVSSFGFWFLG